MFALHMVQYLIIWWYFKETEGSSVAAAEGKPASWQRSVGPISSTRRTLAGIVVRRKQPTPGGATAGPKPAEKSSTVGSGAEAVQDGGKETTPTRMTSQQDIKPDAGMINKVSTNDSKKGQGPPTVGLGLGLLGAYSGSESDESADST